MNEKNGTTEWTELAIGLYDKLTGRNAEITYEFDNMEVYVPSAASNQAVQAPWKLNGTLRIRTKDNANNN